MQIETKNGNQIIDYQYFKNPFPSKGGGFILIEKGCLNYFQKK